MASVGRIREGAVDREEEIVEERVVLLSIGQEDRLSRMNCGYMSAVQIIPCAVRSPSRPLDLPLGSMQPLQKYPTAGHSSWRGNLKHTSL